MLTTATRRVPWRPALTRMIVGIGWEYHFLPYSEHRLCGTLKSDLSAGALGTEENSHAVSKRIDWHDTHGGAEYGGFRNGIRREFAAIGRSRASFIGHRIGREVSPGARASKRAHARRYYRVADDVVDESGSISLCRKDVAGIRKRPGSSYWKRLETYGFSR